MMITATYKIEKKKLHEAQSKAKKAKLSMSAVNRALIDMWLRGDIDLKFYFQ